MMKRFSVLAWIIVSLLYISTFAEAHPNIKGREATGWDTLSGHAAGREIKYIIKPGVPDAIVSLITSAASAWNSVCTFKQESNGHIGEITAYHDTFYNYIAAQFYDPTISGGHYTSWKIMINTASIQTTQTLIHEFGHAIGLKDLYEQSNQNKIMYFREDECTATAPHAQDLWGAKVIFGLHTAHSYVGPYVYHGVGQNGNMHKETCTMCKGWNPIYCTYANNSDRCRRCGYHRYMTNDVPHPTY